MKRIRLVFVSLFLLFCFAGSVHANTMDGRVRPIPTDDISNEFIGVLEEGVQSSRIPSLDGDYFFMKKFVAEYGNYDKHFKMFRLFDLEIPDLVILADVTWEIGGQLSSPIETGCGFVFRNNDDTRTDELDSFLSYQIVMEGKDFFWGLNQGGFISYGRKYFANPSVQRQTRKLAIFANGSDTSVLLDGRELRRNRDVALTAPGMIHYTVQTGTDKRNGTRCIFENVYLFVPEGSMSDEIKTYFSYDLAGEVPEDGVRSRPIVNPIIMPVVEESQSGPVVPDAYGFIDFPRPPEGCPPGAVNSPETGTCYYP